MNMIVITGATSFIGFHLITQFQNSENEIIAVVRPNSSNICRLTEFDNVRIVELDMSDIKRLEEYITHADMFYHLAWEGARLPYRDDAELQQRNYEAAVGAMNTAIRLGCTFFLGSGSQAEYGFFNGSINEDAVCNPLTPYGVEKLHAYETLSRMAEENHMRFIWTRIFSIYGKYDFGGTLIMSCLDKMTKNESMGMTACTQMWDYLHVEDAAKALALFSCVNCENGIYNVASGQPRPLKEFVNDIKDILNSSSEIDFGAVKYGPNGPVNLEPDISKIQTALNWKPTISFIEGIKKMME